MWVMRQLGKQVTPAVDGGVPPALRFLPGAEEVLATLGEVTPDLVIAVDCGDAGRMGQAGVAATASGAPLINLDHHVSNTLFGTANLVDPATVSSTELILDWLPRLGVSLDTGIATCLLTGLVTDTLCFRTDSVTAAVLGKAQRLVEAGAPLSDITQRTLLTKPFADLRLWAEALHTVQMDEGVIWVALDRQTRDRVQATDNGDAGLVSFLVTAEEATVAAVFREKDDGRIEMGFRAKPGFDVGRVAVALGGGGHVLASGATVDGPLDVAIGRALPLLKQAAKGEQAVG
jgi:phosphoesterase RecJ-like protein